MKPPSKQSYSTAVLKTQTLDQLQKLVKYRVPKHRPGKSRGLFQNEWAIFSQVSIDVSIAHKGPFDFQSRKLYYVFKQNGYV